MSAWWVRARSRARGADGVVVVLFVVVVVVVVVVVGTVELVWTVAE